MSDDIRIERLELGPWSTNAYIVTCLRTKNSVLIDAPADAPTIMRSLEGTKLCYILITHSHGDHTGALPELKTVLKIPAGIHPADAWRLPCTPDIFLDEGDVVSSGTLRIEVLHTPGHTAGSLCFKIGRYLFSGDTIFPGGPGKTRSPDYFRQIVKSIKEKILILPDDTEIYPGHGAATTLKKEKSEFAVFSSRPHAPDLCGDVLWRS